MSTRMVTSEDYKFFDFLANYRWPNKPKEQIAHYRELVEHGDLQIETLFENSLVCASNGSYTRVAEMGRDFCDDSDAKKTVSQFRNNNVIKRHWTNSFSIRDIKNKIGLLRAMCYSKEQNKFYFFAIPYSAYAGLSVVEIALDRFSGHKGSPLGIPKGKWTTYQVESFERLATITESEAELLGNEKALIELAKKQFETAPSLFTFSKEDSERINSGDYPFTLNFEDSKRLTEALGW